MNRVSFRIQVFHRYIQNTIIYFKIAVKIAASYHNEIVWTHPLDNRMFLTHHSGITIVCAELHHSVNP